MTSFFYDRGTLSAFERLGFVKEASKPEMGEALFTNISSATGDEGRARWRSHEEPSGMVNTYFKEHDRHMLRDPHNDAHVFPIGVQQSKSASLFHKLVANAGGTDVKVTPEASKRGGGLFLRNERKVLVSKRDPYTLAHELGHAEFDETPLGHVVQDPSKPKRAGSPQTLIGEAGATLKGKQLLQRLSANKKQLKNYDKKSQSIANKYAQYKLQGRRKFRNLDISIENIKGSVRTWYDKAADKEGRTKMQWPYGYIRMTEGLDGDHVDCFIGPNEDAKNVYVVTTNKAPDFKEIDEQKCMLGFDSEEAAKKAFLAHYDKPGFFRSMKTLPYAEFEEQVLSTLRSHDKKVASNMYDSDVHSTSMGPAHDRVPGDYVGLPQSSLVGMRSIKGDAESPADKIDRMFRSYDNVESTRVMEGNSSAYPMSPSQ
jgi:hypothetical protein